MSFVGTRWSLPVLAQVDLLVRLFCSPPAEILQETLCCGLFAEFQASVAL